MSSRYHEIDTIDGKGSYYVRADVQSFSSTSSPLSTSPRFNHYSTGKGDPIFPDLDMQMGMIVGMNSCNGLKNRNLENYEFEERILMRIKFLEDSNTVMQSRNQNLITENKALSDQLEKQANITKEFKSQLEETRAELEKEKNQTIKSENIQRESTDQHIIKIGKIEKSIQCWAVCMACQRKLEGNGTTEPTVTITKSELESLEIDMQALRDAVVTREEAWDKAMEREDNYRQQLSRLSTEILTTRHVADSRHSELEALNVTLVEKEAELEATQKDLISLRKIIVKMERHARDLEENLIDRLGNTDVNFNAINETEQKTIHEIISKQILIKSKQRSRPKGTSSMPQSLQASPRNGLH